MGKKKKVEISANPLQAVTIGQIKENKYGWIFIMIIFILFLGIIYFLPDINKLYETYIKGQSDLTPSVQVPSNENQVEENPEVEDKINTYSFANNNNLTVNNIEFINIKLENNQLSFKVKNIGESNIDLSSMKIYFETYQDSTLSQRIKINGVLENNSIKTFKYSNITSTNNFLIRNINEEDYTYVMLDIDEEGYSILNCTNENEIYTYTFENDKLKKVNYSLKYLKSNLDYTSKYNLYSENVKNYQETSGIDSEIIVNDEGFVYNMSVIHNGSSFKFDDMFFYQEGTTPIIINFEMEASFFACK